MNDVKYHVLSEQEITEVVGIIESRTKEKIFAFDRRRLGMLTGVAIQHELKERFKIADWSWYGMRNLNAVCDQLEDRITLASYVEKRIKESEAHDREGTSYA